MNRKRKLALAWLAATAAPAALAVVLIGCCALPLHGLVHRLLPLCEMAETALQAGHHGDHGGHHSPATPAPKQDSQDGARLSARTENRATFVPALVSCGSHPLPPEVAQRSQTAPGAFRCDDDVGRRLASVDTLRI